MLRFRLGEHARVAYPPIAGASGSECQITRIGPWQKGTPTEVIFPGRVDASTLHRFPTAPARVDYVAEMLSGDATGWLYGYQDQQLIKLTDPDIGVETEEENELVVS